MRAESLADTRPLGVAEHVDKIQVGHHQRCRRPPWARWCHSSDRALTGARQADAPLVHTQGLGAEDDLMQVHEPLGVSRAQDLSHLDVTRLAIFLALPAEPRARKPPSGRGERACGDLAEQGGQRRVKLVGVSPTRYVEHVRDVLRAGAGGAVGREQCKPAKGRSQSSPGGGGWGAPATGRCRLPTQGGGGKKLFGPGLLLVNWVAPPARPPT